MCNDTTGLRRFDSRIRQCKTVRLLLLLLLSITLQCLRLHRLGMHRWEVIDNRDVDNHSWIG